LPTGPTGLDRIFADNDVFGLKPDGSFVEISTPMRDTFATGLPKLDGWGPCARLGILGTRPVFLTGKAGLLGDGFRDVQSLGCAWRRDEGDPNNVNVVLPMAVMGDSKIGLVGHSDAEDITIRDGFTRWSGRGAIRGQGDRATAYVPFNVNDNTIYLFR
jgi:hypothetical protein